jgi:hypothetical protein
VASHVVEIALRVLSEVRRNEKNEHRTFV